MSRYLFLLSRPWEFKDVAFSLAGLTDLPPFFIVFSPLEMVLPYSERDEEARFHGEVRNGQLNSLLFSIRRVAKPLADSFAVLRFVYSVLVGHDLPTLLVLRFQYF